MKNLYDDCGEEYDMLCADCAKRGIKGRVGNNLPPNISTQTMAAINQDPEAFEDRIRSYAYALAMDKLQQEEK